MMKLLLLLCLAALPFASNFRKRTWFMFQYSLIRKGAPFFNKIGETFDPLDKFHHIDETFGGRFQYRKFSDKWMFFIDLFSLFWNLHSFSFISFPFLWSWFLLLFGESINMESATELTNSLFVLGRVCFKNTPEKLFFHSVTVVGNLYFFSPIHINRNKKNKSIATNKSTVTRNYVE